MHRLSLLFSVIIALTGCTPKANQDPNSIHVGESVAKVKTKLALWEAKSASQILAWSHGIPSASASPEEIERFHDQSRQENDFYDDPLFRWQTPSGDCTVCFTAKHGVLTEITLIQAKNHWIRGLSRIERSGRAE
jgi:hypothetical protein